MFYYLDIQFALCILFEPVHVFTLPPQCKKGNIYIFPYWPGYMGIGSWKVKVLGSLKIPSKYSIKYISKMLGLVFKNPAYGRHWISWRLRIVAPMQNGWKPWKTVENGKRMKRVEYGWKTLKTVENGWKWSKTVTISWKLLKTAEIGGKRSKPVKNGWKRLKTDKNSKKNGWKRLKAVTNSQK